MTAMYDTAKQFNRILYWDDDNRLTKTVDTTSGSSIATSYAYDAKGMRISKDGPYGETIYVDTGYVLSNDSVISNHVFMGNTRIASVVKHTEEKQPATYFYASDHLGSSSVLTTQTGSYHERIEYLPYGEVWVEDASTGLGNRQVTSGGYTTPYKFTGKELDAETGLYYFGARYYDARLSRWISTDPALVEGKYFPKANDYDTEHDFYWYIANINIKKLPGIGGVYNTKNLDIYNYAIENPISYYDPDGNWINIVVAVVAFAIKEIWDIATTPRELGDGTLKKDPEKGYTDKQYAKKLLVSISINKTVGDKAAEKVYKKAKEINKLRASTKGGMSYRERQVENIENVIKKPGEEGVARIFDKILDIFKSNNDKIDNRKDPKK